MGTLKDPPHSLQAVAKDILRGGAVSADDVLALRRGVFKDGVVDRDEADLLFYLDAHGGGGDAWLAFFVEALTVYFVEAQYPPGVLCREDADYLVARVTEDGRIDRHSEFALLLHIAERAKRCPDEIGALLLRGVRETVLGGGGPLFGPGRRRSRVIDDADVDVVRKAVYATGGDSGFTVGRDEAALLFEFNDATVNKDNAPAWRRLFVEAVGNYLMFPRPPQTVLSAEEYRRLQDWLDSRPGIAATIGDAVSALFDGGSQEALNAFLSRRGEDAAEELEHALGDSRDARERSAVDEQEAAWLVAQISENDVLDANECALLAHIKETATDIHPSLDPWFAKCGL